MSITKIRKRYEDNGYVVYAPEDEMTFCNVCGKPVLRGMTTDNGDCHVHEDCFDKYMDDEYGKGKWKGVDELPDYEFPDNDGYGGYYVYLDENNEWVGTGIYYTEWEDDFDAEWFHDRVPRNTYKFYVNRDENGNIKFIIAFSGLDNEGNNTYITFENPTENEIKWEVKE